MAHDLASKTLAGIVLGDPLAFALHGIYGYLGPGSRLDNYWVAVFLLLPVWTGLLSLAFAYRSGWRAWGVILGNAVGFGVLAFARQWPH